MKNKVVLFEIPASDLKKAKQFYESVFDWKVELFVDEGAMALTTPADKDYTPTVPGGINGGFYKRKSNDDHPSCGIETDSIDETLRAIEQAGGKGGNPETCPRWAWVHGRLCRSRWQRPHLVGKAEALTRRGSRLCVRVASRGRNGYHHAERPTCTRFAGDSSAARAWTPKKSRQASASRAVARPA